MATPSHNLDSVSPLRTEFMFSEGATDSATATQNGFLFFGNVADCPPTVELTKAEHTGSYRGQRRVDKTHVTAKKMSYKLKLDELKLINLAIAFDADAGTDFTQGSATTVSGTPLVFSGGSPSSSNKWYDIRTAGGARLRNLTAVTVATLTEGTDFEVDLTMGSIRFLTTQTASRTPVYSAPAITSSDAAFYNALKPLQGRTRSGVGRFVFFDDDATENVAFTHEDFTCEITVDAMDGFDGAAEATVTFDVLVTGDPGTVLVRSNRR